VSDGNLQSGTLAPLLAHLAAVGLLLLFQLQQWLALRLTNPCAAYAQACSHMIDATRAVGRRTRRTPGRRV
jgi:hypothetical protein